MKRVLILVLLLLLCAPTALAAPSLDAQLTDGNLYITWSGCNCPEAILTVYRDNWPVLVTCVCGADGEYTVPSWYTQTAGLYAAQLRCNEGCIRVEAGSASPTEEPAAQPTPAPTAAFTAKPTVEPTAVPTVEPTPQATPSPTATSTPAVTATPLPTAPANAATDRSSHHAANAQANSRAHPGGRNHGFFPRGRSDSPGKRGTLLARAGRADGGRRTDACCRRAHPGNCRKFQPHPSGRQQLVNRLIRRQRGKHCHGARQRRPGHGRVDELRWSPRKHIARQLHAHRRMRL